MKRLIYFLLTFLFVSNLQGQKKAQDTLFFKFDNSYIKDSETHENEFFIKDRNSDEVFFFKGTETLYNLKHNEILCLKKIVRQSTFYNKAKKQKLNNSALVDFFSDNITYLVRKKNGRTEYIKVKPLLKIYD